MINSISNLEPKGLWDVFSKLLQIPHPSGFEQKMANFICEFAKANCHQCTVDEVGNVIVDLKACPEKQNAPLVILQGHMDMVPVCKDGFTHDFKQDPIEALIDNGKIKADHTSLGADNGIAIAMMLSLMAKKDLKAGPLRMIFTVEEETSMKGASNIDKKYLQGDYLINLDSEDNGYLFVSCAGSCDINLSFEYQKIATEHTKGLKINLDNFSGGHSGADIHLGRANAIKVLASILNSLTFDFDFFIEKIEGGTVRNSIPTFASASIAVDVSEFDKVKAAIEEAFKEQALIYSATDKNARLSISEQEVTNSLSYAQTQDLISLLLALPNGILRLSPLYEGNIVETSINLGVISTCDKSVDLCLLPRSLTDLSLNDTIDRVSCIVNLLDNVKMKVQNLHPAWQSPSDNHLIKVLNDCYKKVTGNSFKITALHAGVECAQFVKANPNLQLISIGPTISSPHSIYESLDIQGTNDMYNTLLLALEIL